MNDVIGRTTDVHQTLAYNHSKMGPKFLELGLVSLGCGAFLLWISDSGSSVFDWLMVVLAFALGGVATLYGLSRWLGAGKPLLVLSPEGLRRNIEWVKSILIPWSEVRGVDTVDITGSVRGYPVFLPGVTVVLVSRAFYDRHIHVRSWILRGPGWDTQFIPRGDMVEVALHHEALPATAQELRTAVEARWRAFGGERSPRPA
jgi:hypothetical protein